MFMQFSFQAPKDYLDLILSLYLVVQPQERDITSKAFGDDLVPSLLHSSTSLCLGQWPSHS